MPPTLLETSKDPLEVVVETEQQWLFTEDELLRSPSICDGMPPEEERMLRSKGVNFITQVGIMLKLSHSTLGTAAVFFNRFLMRRSLVERDGIKPLHQYVFSSHLWMPQNEGTDEIVQQVAAVSVFLATKVEEHVRKVKELVIACCRIAQKNPNLVVDEQTKDFWRWRDSILYNEDQMLEWLCFDLTIESPFKILYDLVKYYGHAGRDKDLRSAAWGFINDSHLTQMCLLFPSKVIACAALYAACRITGASLEDEQGQPWWTKQRVKLQDVRRAVNYMAEWYSKSQPLKPTQSEEIYRSLLTPEHGSEESAKTRMKEGTSLAGSPASSAMERSTSQQSLKRPREEDDDGDVVAKEEADKVHRSDEENERREANGRPKPRTPQVAGRTPAAVGGTSNGSAVPPWAQPKGPPVTKRAKIEDTGATDMPIRAPETGNTAVALRGGDDDAEEGEVDE